MLAEFTANSVASIGSYGFANCTGLKTINIPVVDLAGNVFYGCSKLATANLPKVQTIGSYCFANCSLLSRLTLSDSLKTIANHAFSNCTTLPAITLPSSLNSLGSNAFEYCSSLQSIVLPDNITSLPEYAFSGCSALESAQLPANVSTLGSYAFNGCKRINAITIPAKVTSISSTTFNGCEGLTSLVYADGTTTALRTYATYITSVSIPEGVTKIEKNAFYNSSRLTEVTLPASLTSIGSDAFAGCSALTTLVYAEGTKTALRTYAPALTNVTIPSSVSRIQDDAFTQCTKLARINISNLEMWNLIFSNATSDPFPYPHDLYFNGQALTDLIADFGRPVHHWAFSNVTGLLNVTLTATTTAVEDYAFQKCPDLVSFVMGNGTSSIGKGAFLQCSNLQSAKFGSALTSIGANAFSGCAKLKSVKTGGAEQTIGNNAFDGCSALQRIHLPATVNSIGAYAFRQCTSLEETNIPEGVTTIPEYAFYSCTHLGDLTLPSTLASIGKYAFYNCDGFSTVDLPAAVKSVGDYAYSGCDALRFLYIGSGITNIGQYAFANLSILGRVVCRATSVPSTSSTAFSNSHPEAIPLFVPGESISNYDSSSPWKDFNAVSDVTTYNPPAKYVVVTPSTLVLADEGKATLSAKVYPEGASQRVSWTSSDSEAVEVTSRGGAVQAFVEGVYTITCTAGDGSGVYDICTVIVDNNYKSLTSLTIDAPKDSEGKYALTLTEGDKHELTASFAPDDATFAQASWTSSDEHVATVNSEGFITAVEKGTCTITVTAMDGSNLQVQCKVTVNEPVYSSFSTIGDADGDGMVTQNDINALVDLLLGKRGGVDTSAFDINGDGKIDIQDIATVVTALKGGGTAMPVGQLKYLAFGADSYSLTTGEQRTIDKVIVPFRAGANLSWQTSDAAVASVTPDGKVTANAPGRAVITVSATDGSNQSAQTSIIVLPVTYGQTDGCQWVDLALPSGTRWATMNIGATTAEQYGDYIAWGETTAKSKYSWATYTLCDGAQDALKKYCTARAYGNKDGITMLETADDAASQRLSQKWTVPSKEQYAELFNSDYTQTVWTTQNGVRGLLVTSRVNGNKVFFPAAGYKDGTTPSSAGTGGYYAMREIGNPDYLNLAATFGSSGAKTSETCNRYLGQTIRPVIGGSIGIDRTSVSMDVGESCKLNVMPATLNSSSIVWRSSDPETVSVTADGTIHALKDGSATIYATLPAADDNSVATTAYCKVSVVDTNGHAYVDLGLSVKWATMNVGATEVAGSKTNSHTGKLDCYGEYYAWGETSPKDRYDWAFYFDSNNSKYNNNGGKTKLDLDDDAARANWGGSWRMPTYSEQTELQNNCYWEWTSSYNNTGVKGYIVYKVKNDSDKGRKKYSGSSTTTVGSYLLSDSHIFLPAAGYRGGTYFLNVASDGCYWSSSLDASNSDHAYELYFNSSNVDWNNYYRCNGQSVRAVCP